MRLCCLSKSQATYEMVNSLYKGIFSLHAYAYNSEKGSQFSLFNECIPVFTLFTRKQYSFLVVVHQDQIYLHEPMKNHHSFNQRWRWNAQNTGMHAWRNKTLNINQNAWSNWKQSSLSFSFKKSLRLFHLVNLSNYSIFYSPWCIMLWSNELPPP